MYVYRCSVICIYMVSHVHTNHMHIIVCLQECVYTFVEVDSFECLCNCISEHMHKGWAIRGRHSGRHQKISHYDWFLKAMDWKNHLSLFEEWGESLCVHRDLLGWMKITISWCQKPDSLGKSPSGLSSPLPYLSFAIPSPIFAWSSDLVLPTALEQGCLSLGQWVLPGSALACRVSVSTSGFWLRRFGLGSEILHFNKFYRWFWCRWHGRHWETVWLREHSGGWLTCVYPGQLSPRSCLRRALWHHWRCQLPPRRVLAWVWYSFNTKIIFYFLFLCWSSFGHISKSSTHFVMNPHLLVRRPSNDQTVCFFSATNYTPKNKKNVLQRILSKFFFHEAHRISWT